MESTITSNVKAKPNASANYTVPLVILTTLFFMWGFLTVLNDILIPHLKGVFDLTYFQAMAVQMAFFGAYFFVSYPAGILVKRVGYKTGVVIGLIIAGIGCALFYPAASLRVYGIFLGALFVLASGITILQVSANPYVSLLGPSETAPRRLTLTQAFNSLGTTVGPFFGSMMILSTVTATELVGLSPAELEQHNIAEANAVQIPYLGLAATLVGLAVIFALLKNLPHIIDSDQSQVSAPKSAWQYSHLVLGAIGIFAYVGAEVSIGSFLVNFIGEPHIGNMPEQQAGKLISYYWGGAMLGRFVGVALMSYIKPAKLLAINALVIIALLVVGTFTSGGVAMWAVLAIGLFNSIMFPTIFSLAIAKLGPATSQASGILCMAIVGGAVIPPIQGLLADNIGLQLSFLLPIICYAYIIYFAVIGHKPKED
ncbi:L-fucose-proton symporter [Thalassocella blandensis]|nr:L-fucose-proton symporter [Thalassocella blandensis]